MRIMCCLHAFPADNVIFSLILQVITVMAEFPGLGKYCGLEGCQQLDFLPFQCKRCQRIFCLDHRSVDAHKCPVEATDREPEPGNDVTGNRTAENTASCEFSDCKTTLNRASVVCKDCNRNFCLQHRHPFDHDCASAKESQPPSLSKAAQFVEGLNKKSTSKQTTTDQASVSSKNAVTAAKIQLMKLKQTAVGDAKLPQEERLYLRLVLPAGCAWKNSQDLPIFFSRSWTVGKCVSTAVNCGGLKNEIIDDGVKKRLRLKVSSGRVCIMDEHMRKLEEAGEVVNGGNASLVYE